MNRGHLKRAILKGKILARLGHSYGYDDATYDKEFDAKRKFVPANLLKDNEDKIHHAKEGQINFSDWDLRTKSGWLSKEKNELGVRTLGIHSNLSFEVVEKKMWKKLKEKGLI